MVELMITVAIVAILAAIAYPSYQEQVRKTRRADAKGTLLDVAQQLERCYSTYRAYNDTTCPVVGDSSPRVNVTSPEGYYQIVSTDTSGTETLGVAGFTLRAVPQGVQAGDTRCANMTYTSTEVRAAVDSAGTNNTAQCW